MSSVSFHVRSLRTIVNTCQAAGLKIARAASQSQCWINTPGDVLVELLEIPNLGCPIQFYAINFSSDARDAMATWYARFLDGEFTPDAEGIAKVNVPGVELRLAKSDSAGLPTKGRSLDHIGFDVNDLGRVYDWYSASGIEFESPPRVAPNGITRVTFCNDPWGTRIELTEKISALL
ncbi:MAG: VOC family protein [Candidatus Acidiferrales bacterium]